LQRTKLADCDETKKLDSITTKNVNAYRQTG